MPAVAAARAVAAHVVMRVFIQPPASFNPRYRRRPHVEFSPLSVPRDAAPIAVRPSPQVSARRLPSNVIHATFVASAMPVIADV